MERESYPRISNRLLIASGGEPLDADYLQQKRIQCLKKINEKKGRSFDVKNFLTDTMLPEVVNKIRSKYRTFLEAVSSIEAADNQQNAAKILYNIGLKPDVDSSFKEATGLFGQIPRANYNKLVKAAVDLKAFSDEQSASTKDESWKSSLGLTLNFAPPTSLSDLSKLELYVADEDVSGGDGNDVSKWLLQSCKMHIQNSVSAFDVLQLATEIVQSCTQNANQTEFEVKLFDLLGENAFEFMMTIIERKKEIALINLRDLKRLNEELPPMVSGHSAPLDSSELQASNDWLRQIGFADDYLLQERALGLQKNKHSTSAYVDNWMDNLAPAGTTEVHEKRGLPAGSEMSKGPGFEEVFIPAAKKPVIDPREVLVQIEDLEEEWARLAFAGTKSLNRIQSKVFSCAYQSNENMLICAPTGAGKTNIAMLTFLRLIQQNIVDGAIDLTAIKAVYIAPMKALAQEVVAKFSDRLKPLGLTVKEYTGDMQLTKQEVNESQLLVCTPEKYDVITRKGGEGSLGTLVSLIIIDEVHLLADERGAVIETIVARTQRYVESSQKYIRIVGLSATLPNYQDVALFLRVNLRSGLFYFGPEYRPIPLDQTLIGVTEKQKVKRNDIMNKLAFDKLIAALERGKQVMIFVHSRKEASRTAEAIIDLSGKHGTTSLFDNVQHEQYTLWKRQVDKSRSQEVQQLFAKGVGVHHAGMLRSDRSMTEQLFECGLLKLLCCTATLAWGINLPAHTVIIKGTEMYDPERGGFVDISILDVLQIFGRAGRPQYDNSGHAILITPHKTLATYLGLLGHQAPIESGLIKALADHLNAEIVNGTVNNIKEAASWLSYTFLFVRMCKNPLAYGIKYDEVFADPRLESKRLELVKEAADLLDTCMMIRYDKRSGNLGVTDLGRIASHYYIKHGTIEAFNNMLTPHLNDPDALHVLCSSAEFDQLKVRPEEIVEIESLKKEMRVVAKGGSDDTATKVNILLQGYMNHFRVKSFTLQSDTNYVAQNTGRIARALFEICLKRGWSTMAGHYLTLCKAIDRRMRVDQTPLRQFNELPPEVIKRLEDTQADVNKLLDMGVKEVGQLIHNQKMASKVLSLSQQLPHLKVEAVVQPITRGIIRLCLTISSDFEWNDRVHGFAQPFWIWVEDGENEYIYHSEYFVLLKKQRFEEKTIDFTIPIREPLPPQYYVRTISDTWVGCETSIALSFKNLILPTQMMPYTNLLDMHPVPKSALRNAKYESLYKFTHFNPIQSQTFHVLYYTDHNVLIGAPTGSGKTITAELAILRMKRERPGAKAIYIAPLKALARERLTDWKQKLGVGLGLTVLELTGDITPNIEDLRRADILIVTPEKWDSISRGWQKREYVSLVELVIIDEIHLLGVDRGPVLEVIVSRMRFISSQTARPIRFVGLSTALANPRDLADWLGIGDIGVYNFRPSVRPIPMTIHIQGFPGKHYCPRMATMNKPAYAAILEHSPTKPSLIFVSSRRQTRLTALDLISYCAADDNPKQFLHMPEDEIAAIASTLRDRALRDTIVFGIAIHHAGLDNHDRNVVEELYFNGKVQVLVCTSTLAWGVNLPCHLVIVKGTEFFDGKQGRYVDFPVTDVLQMMGRAGRPQFDETGVSCIFVHEPKKNFYRKFLHEPFPVESSLQNQLHEHFNAEIAMGTITNTRDCMEYLTWTYFFRRLVVNPSYYGLEVASPENIEKFLLDLSTGIIKDLQQYQCVQINELSDFSPSVLGRITSYYYLHYRTAGLIKSRFDALMESNKYPVSTESVNQELLQVLVKLMTDAFEFSELPVRHCEDELNADLAKIVPWSTENMAMDSPHTKTFLLLQAHFYGTALPITDYINDTKSVLDQVPRVLNAMIEVAVECGYGMIVLHLMKISQLVIQGLSPTSSELSQLPKVPSKAFDRLSSSGLGSLKLLAAARPGAIESALNKGESLGQRTVGDVLQAVKDIPVLKIEGLTVQRNAQSGSGSASTDEGVFRPSASFTTGLNSTVSFSLSRASGSSRNVVYTPRYHKEKTASWAILVECKGQVLAFKKLAGLDSEQKLKMLVSLGSIGNADIKVHVLCDALIGTDNVEKCTVSV